MADPRTVDPVLWCLCADYLATKPHQVGWLWMGANRGTDGGFERSAILRVAEHATFPPPNLPAPAQPTTLLDQFARAVLLNTCPAGDASSDDEQLRLLAKLKGLLWSRWMKLLNRQPAPSGLNRKVSEYPDFAEYAQVARKWHDEHRWRIERAFSDSAMAHLKSGEEADFDFDGLADELTAIRCDFP